MADDGDVVEETQVEETKVEEEETGMTVIVRLLNIAY